VFEKRVLNRMFGPKRDKVTREWRKLHNEELNDLYFPPNIVRVIKSRRIRWTGHVARMGERRGVYRVLVGTPEGYRPPWRPRRRWEDNIKMDLQEVGCGGVDWVQLAQYRDTPLSILFSDTLKLCFPLSVTKFHNLSQYYAHNYIYITNFNQFISGLLILTSCESMLILEYY
jgi:hypothetical protein